MNSKIRRFAAVLSLTVVLTAAVPAAAAPADRGDRDRTSIGRFIQRIMQRIRGAVSVQETPTVPIPAPTTPTPSIQ